MLDTKGSGYCTLEQLDTISLPRRTRSYRPVSHRELIKMTEDVAGGFGLQISNPQIGVARGGQQMFSVYEVAGQDHCDNKVALMLGLRNSYDKSMAAGVCFGSKVFVCSNLCFSGYTDENQIIPVASHRHTVMVWDVLRDRIAKSLQQVPAFVGFQNKLYEGLSDTKVNTDLAYATMVRASQQDVIAPTDISKVVDIWHSQERIPNNDAEAMERHWTPDFEPRNAWSLFNAFTQHSKKVQESNPVKANKRSINLTRLFVKEFVSAN